MKQPFAQDYYYLRPGTLARFIFFLPLKAAILNGGAFSTPTFSAVKNEILQA